MGLREQKKQRRNKRVLQAAMALFHEKGFAGTTMSAVAARADLAVGTLYNYYSSKDQLLIAVLKDEFSRIGFGPADFEEGQDPVQFIMQPMERLLLLLQAHDKDMWLELSAAIYKAGRTVDEAVFELDWMLIAELTGRLSVLKQADILASTVDTTRAGMILFSSFLFRFQMYLMGKGVTTDTLKAELLADIELIFQGFRQQTGEEL